MQKGKGIGKGSKKIALPHNFPKVGLRGRGRGLNLFPASVKSKAIYQWQDLDSGFSASFGFRGSNDFSFLNENKTCARKRIF